MNLRSLGVCTRNILLKYEFSFLSVLASCQWGGFDFEILILSAQNDETVLEFFSSFSCFIENFF